MAGSWTVWWVFEEILQSWADLALENKDGVEDGGSGSPGMAGPGALTEVFWHCTLELLKRRAGTLCSVPWMLRMHSYPRCPDCGCGRFLAFRVMGLITSTGTRILSTRSSCGQSWKRQHSSGWGAGI